MIDLHTKEFGYEEISPPLIASESTMFGTGQLPKFEEDLFKLSGEKDFYLTSTAEIPVTNLLREKIIESKYSSQTLQSYRESSVCAKS